MPNFQLKQQPKYAMQVIDTDLPITKEDLAKLFTDTNGITVCVRSKTGDEKRGGYFFCIEKIEQDMFRLLTMESETVVERINLDTLTSLINHASGLKFDKKMFELCLNEINFRED